MSIGSFFFKEKPKTGIKVGDIMTKNYVYVSPETSILDCAKTMVKKNVGSLLIQEKDRILGIITEGDIIYALAKKPKDLSKIKVIELARKKLITIQPSADVAEALFKMRKTKIRWLPVVVKNKPVGFITLKDILRLEPALFESVSEIMDIKEKSEKLKRIKESKKGKRFIEGKCESCGNFDILYENNSGTWVCNNCL
ncbi:MAG: CBS domain-containing protein [Candidatus Pacearchaeota archaeon]